MCKNSVPRTRDGLGLPAARDAEIEELRKQRDAALAASQRTEADLTALRNINQRLMVENTELLEAAPEQREVTPSRA
ncbi:hypothetical protein [Streptomyces sp. NPDC014676]|uniref:hypothetical protein n=1 Tax=Streptomyces sp. NPDC014676 TaxID=3364879 RepID=UPI0036F5C664